MNIKARAAFLTMPLGIVMILFVLTACDARTAHENRGEPVVPSASGETNDMESKKSGASITGTISYRERILLRPGSVLTIALEDVSRADAAAIVIAELSITDPGQVPIAFELPYDPAAIDERMTYAMRARISSTDGDLLFINDTHIPVLTRGAGSEVDMQLLAVGSKKSASSENEAPGMELGGMFRYMADAPRFRDCSTGKSFPVEMSGQYIELERAYLNSGIEGGEELRVNLRGRYLERPGMEENTSEIKLIVDEFTGISENQDCTPTHHAELINTYWKLVEVNGSPVRPARQQREAHMVLQSGEARVQGNGGCNTFFGSYVLNIAGGELQGQELKFSGLGSTMMACPDSMDVEQAFLLALTETNRAVVSGQFLEVFDGDRKLARFEAVYLQ